jgi:hypothetical protein
MPVTKLDPGTPLDDAPSSRITLLPAGTQLDQPAPPPPASGAFFGAAKMLPESVQRFLPEFMKGPSVGEQLTASTEQGEAEAKKLGRPLTLKERLAAEPVTDSPVAMGFATHQIGGVDVPAPKIGTAGRAEFTRAAKPSEASLRAAGGREPYYEKTEGAIKSIVENRDNLHFVDPDGNVVSGELPKSLDQFSDAVDQTKQTIFKKYDDMAKRAGMFGATVDLRSIVPELNKIATDQVVVDFHPDVAKYAADKANTLLSRGGYYAEDAQRAIQNLNTSLKAFYRNPTYELAGRASVDAMVANRLRTLLDDTVENFVGPGYQDLKNQYGELKAIENDVKKRAVVVSRQEKGGGILGRIADVTSATEVLRGLVSLRPEVVAKGVLLKAWEKFVKHRRDPNTAVMNLFRRASTPVVPLRPASPFSAVTSSPDDTMQGVAGAGPL